MTSNDFSVTGNDTWDFGAIFGDVNPIHMNGITAKLFGQKGRIVHGMHAVAKCLSLVETKLMATGDADHGNTANHLVPSRSWAVSFKGPVPCGAKLAILKRSSSDGATSVDLHVSGSKRPSICIRPISHSSL